MISKVARRNFSIFGRIFGGSKTSAPEVEKVVVPKKEKEQPEIKKEPKLKVHQDS